MRRMGVKKPHPEIPRNPFNPFQQPGQGRTARRIDRLAGPGFLVPEIHPVISRVLANQVNFFDAFFDKMANLGLH